MTGANAILDGTDCIMLSGETASGAWPEAAVETMDRIARATEASSEYERYLQRRREALDGDGDPGHVIADSASWTADRIGASCIVIPTLTGYTAQLASKHRSRRHIVTASPGEKVRRRLLLYWG